MATEKRAKRGRRPKPDGRGDKSRTIIGVSCSPAEIDRVDEARGELARAEYVRRHGVPGAKEGTDA